MKALPPLTVGIFLFHEVEVLDFAGPFEVLSLAKHNEQACCKLVTIAENDALLSARNGLKIKADYTFRDHPNLDILIVPGGFGAEELEIKKQRTLDWLSSQATKVNLLASICTGALLLAQAGLLDGKRATTHWMDLDRLEQDYPRVEVVRKQRYVHDGNTLSSGGISAGIDMSFYLLVLHFGWSVAQQTALQMEYNWKAEPPEA